LHGQPGQQHVVAAGKPLTSAAVIDESIVARRAPHLREAPQFVTPFVPPEPARTP
jgi:hypothetical protein